jgi:glycosyltransferase involved in cell wall biosynthesis
MSKRQLRHDGSDRLGQLPEVPAATIVIPTLNEEKYLPLLLESLRRVSAPMEIIVVDGNSTDRTAEVVEEYRPHFSGHASLRLLRSDQRHIAYQRNVGGARATHDILIFCDADVVVPSREHYAKLISHFAERRLVVAAPVVIPVEPGLHFKLTFKLVYLLQRIVLRSGRPGFGGGYLLTSKDVFTRLGGFDARLSLGEDVDYALRAARLGPYELIHVPIAISARRLIHYGYGWIFDALPSIVRFIRTGYINPESIHYPFGEYNEPRGRRFRRRSRL